jgi:hypothetical protein
MFLALISFLACAVAADPEFTFDPAPAARQKEAAAPGPADAKVDPATAPAAPTAPAVPVPTPAEAKAVAPNADVSKDAASSPSAKTSAPAAVDASPGKDRRTFHQGRWWYLHPNNSWSYYSENRWVPYSAERYQAGYRGVTPEAAPSPAPQSAYHSAPTYYRGQGGYGGRSQEPSGGANGQPNDRFIRGG